jgi:hypothetical protein
MNTTTIKKLHLSEEMYTKLELLNNKLLHGGMTNEQVKEFLAIDVNTAALRRYLQKVDVKYDWALKLWRRRKERVSLEEKLDNLYRYGKSIGY